MKGARKSLATQISCDTFYLGPGPLFTKRQDVLRSDLEKSRRREIGCYNDCIALKFDRLSAAALPSYLLNFRTIGNVETQI